jgi:hypothetical protein
MSMKATLKVATKLHKLLKLRVTGNALSQVRSCCLSEGTREPGAIKTGRK